MATCVIGRRRALPVFSARLAGLPTIVVASLLLAACSEDTPPADPGLADTTAPAPASSATRDSVVEQPARAVVSDTLPYAEVGDELVYGHFVFPSDMVEPLPAVIIIHEWWGLNDSVKATADRLAGQGYIVLAVDLFGGQTASDPTSARKLMLSVVEDPESANENIRGAFEFVSETAGAPRVGAIGWRFGGTWALNAALLYPDDLDAAVVYYAQVISDEDKLRPVNAPILGLFAADDVSVKVDQVEAFKSALEALRKDYDIQVYAGVRQRFASESANTYDATAANDAWNRTLDFLGRHLGGDSAAADGS